VLEEVLNDGLSIFKRWSGGMAVFSFCILRVQSSYLVHGCGCTKIGAFRGTWFTTF